MRAITPIHLGLFGQYLVVLGLSPEGILHARMTTLVSSFFELSALEISPRRLSRQGEGVVYLLSLGRPTDIGLQLDKACYPCSR